MIRFSLRIEDSLMDKLKIISEENGRSLNKEIEQLIIKHIRDYENDFGIIPLPNTHKE